VGLALDLFSVMPGAGPQAAPFICVYKITNTVTGAAYIGLTRKGIEARFAMHWKASKREDSVLYRAMRKYGRSAFKIEILVAAQHPDHLSALERRLIKKHKTFVALGGYNMTHGGEGSPGICDEVRERMRIAARLRMQNPETKAKMIMSLTGRKPSPERMEKYRLSAEKRRGIPLSEEHRRNAAAGQKGKIISAEQRAKISAKLTGRKLPQSHIDATASGNRGKKRSEKSIANMKAAANIPYRLARRSEITLGRWRARKDAGFSHL
jgi:group I intron endonuclease